MSERPALRAAKARLRDKFFRTKWLVALIAAGEMQSDAVAAFNGLF